MVILVVETDSTNAFVLTYIIFIVFWFAIITPAWAFAKSESDFILQGNETNLNFSFTSNNSSVEGAELASSEGVRNFLNTLIDFHLENWVANAVILGIGALYFAWVILNGLLSGGVGGIIQALILGGG